MAPKADFNATDHMVIRNVTPNIVTFSLPLIRAGGIKFGGRATLVKLTAGTLAVFSPVPLTDEVKARVAEMGGKVAYIVAPNFEHHLNISAWATAYPTATLVGPEGLQEKRAKNASVGDENFSIVFTRADKGKTRVGDDFDADFEYEYVSGHANLEIAFFYRPDRVLIQADLLFNLPALEQHSRLSVNKRESGGRFGVTIERFAADIKWIRRLNWYAVAKDRASFNESVRRIAEWDFATIIPCHGDVLERKGKERFVEVFEWNLKGRMK